MYLLELPVAFLIILISTSLQASEFKISNDGNFLFYNSPVSQKLPDVNIYLAYVCSL